MPIIHDYSQIQVIYPELARAKLGITAGGVLSERKVSTTAPLIGGGDLSKDRTLSLPKASAVVNGYLSAADFAQFNAKQGALIFATPLHHFSGILSIPAATADIDGYLTAEDFATFLAGSSPAAFVQVSIVAGENLAAYDPVTSLGMKADSTNPSAGFGRVIGMASAAITSGFSGTIVEIGELTNPAWAWTPGDSIFLSGTTLASTPPITGFVQQLGTAKSATEIVLDIGVPLLL